MIKKVSIKTTVIVFIVVSGILLSLSTGLAISMFNKVSHEAQEAKDRHQAAALYANDMKIAVIQVQQFLSDVSATGDREGFQYAEKYAKSFKESLIKLKNVDASSEEKLNVLEKQFDNYYSLGKKMTEAYLTGGRESGNTIMEEFDKTATDLSDKVDVTNSGYKDKFDGSISDLNKNLAASTQKTIGILAGGIIFLLISSILLTKKIFPALSSLENAMQNIREGDGDLRRRIEITSKDEIGAVTNNFNGLMNDIHKIISDIKNMFQPLKDTADQLFANAQQTSAASTETASTTSEVAASLEEISKNSKNIYQLSLETNQFANTGQEGMNKIIGQMEVIRQSSQKVASQISELSDASDKIQQILNLIDQIAGQTNLLALNAAIEAARAGEQGRGFAVVAEEVRKLAEKSAEATKEVYSLVSTIREESKKAVITTDEENRLVLEGVEVVKNVNSSFKNIIESIQQLADQVQSADQAVEEISIATQNVAATTEEQNAVMEEITAASQTLSKMASNLDSIIRKFRV